MATTSITESLKVAARTWRVASVSLLSISSGLPLGLVLMLEPYWLATSGVDVKTIGLVTVAQAPYAFKFLWSPLLDRYRPPWLGRRRGWVLLWQLVLAALGFALASQAGTPAIGTVAALTVLIAFASASQDIALDAYCVDVLDRDEQGLAVGARTALYRVGMFVSGGIAVSVGPWLGWGVTFAALSVIYLLLAPVAVLAPEPVAQPPAPRSLREAIWEPFVGFLQKNRALEIVAFLLLYKLADNLAVALVRPFLDAKGYSSVDVGVAMGTVGLVFTLAGTFVGGLLTTQIGVGRALWAFGILQALGNVGYAVVAQAEPSRPLMYVAMALDTTFSGMGTGAFMVLLMRLTQKRFSATQYALFSSVFALGRTVAGPIAGSLVDAFGWRDFFLLTVAFSLPGLAMLQRFVPWGSREIPAEVEGGDEVEAAPAAQPAARSALIGRALLGLVAGAGLAALANATLSGLKGLREGAGLELIGPLHRMLAPSCATEWIETLGVLACGLTLGLGWAAHTAARRGTAGAGPGPRPQPGA